MTTAPRLPRPLGPGRRAPFALLVAIGVGQAVGGMGLAMSSQWAFDALVPTGGGAAPTVDLTWILVGLAGAVALTAGCRGAERAVAEWLGQRYVTAVRDTLFAHLTTVPARTLNQRRNGSMLMRFVGDLSALRSWVSLGLARLTVAGVTVVLVLIGLALMHRDIALTVTLVLLAGSGLTWLAGLRLIARSRVARRRRARLTGEVAERLGNIATVQASGQSQRERRRVGKHSTKVARAMVGRARTAGLVRAITEATAGCATIGVLLVGAHAVRRGETSAGTIVGALAVVGFLVSSLRDLGRVAEYAAGAKVGREAAQRFLELDRFPDDPSLPTIPDGPGRLEFKSVRLGQVIRELSATLEPGTTVAIVGRNGVGKSTLISLAARLIDPDSGSVRLDGLDLTEISMKSLRKEIGVVSPDLPLIRGSVRRNVCYRNPRVDDESLAAVVELCGLDKVIGELPQGWDTNVGEGGRLLSSGQRARIALARAMLGNPRLLVLDEVEAHLDPHTQALMHKIVAAREGSTLVITHHEAMARAADVIWHLADGTIVEAGSPSSLFDSDTETARLFTQPQSVPTP